MKKKLLISILIAFVVLMVASVLFIKLGTRAVNSKSKTPVIFTFKPGDSRGTIINKLADAGLIRNKLSAKIYVNIHRGYNLQANTYELNKSMSLKEILTKFDKGEIYDSRKTGTLTFVPGKRITTYADQIADFINKHQEENNNKITKDDVINEISDKEYVKTLINKYWFLTDEVLDGEIYYPLEGYLFPETYTFYEDATIKTIVERMLNTTSTKLEKYKEQITNSGYSVHQILSAAAIIEKEANSVDDRKKVSQVIYSRIKQGMNLGMDVTAYYAAKVEQTKDNPYMYAWNFLPSKYNTRNKNNLGLPVGPICNPSISSIDAALNPSNTNYLYFYADINTGKVYFAEDYAGFEKIQKDLGVK